MNSINVPHVIYNYPHEKIKSYVKAAQGMPLKGMA